MQELENPGPTGLIASDMEALVDELAEGFRRTAQEMVPRFLEQMPVAYFEDSGPATRLTHLRAIIAAVSSGQPLRITLRSDDGLSWTFIHDADHPGLLVELVRQLPTDQPLRAARVHTAADGHVALDVFEFGERPRFDPEAPGARARMNDIVGGVSGPTAEALAAHLQRCASDYVMGVPPARIRKHWEIFRRVSGTDGVAVEIEREAASPEASTLSFAVSNAAPRRMFERIASLLHRIGVDIRRAHLDVVDDPPNGKMSMLTFRVRGPGAGSLDANSPLWPDLRRDLLRIKWVDETTLGLASEWPELGLAGAEVLCALSSLAHQILAPKNRYAFARDRLLDMVQQHRRRAASVIELFLDRFGETTSLDAGTLGERAARLRQEIDVEVDADDARQVLHALIDCVEAVRQSNLRLENRYAFAARVDPALFDGPDRERPYSVFFVYGRDFEGFHVRFRRISRGGVRAVRPIGVEQHALDGERLYSEAYDLAFAQQLKNKDIPEGGAKGVLLLRPGAPTNRCVKAFADALLDLATHPPAVESCADTDVTPDLLHLGPDENISPDLIEWIVARAERRGYPMPGAFMSSKPGAGINHKEYGVTSEGVTVFLEAALIAVGIDPRARSFTVKLTGGPDGDVAGNEIRILHREYGDRAKIVGIADGSGVGEDPDGLDHAELIRLFDRGLPIARFDRERLRPRGRIVEVSAPDGVHLRNTMHNRVEANAFIPAGGRPESIRASNWRDFLRPDGRPSSRIIIEGANLFLTAEARRALSDEAGVIIVKDSSANKCGVICSSYEIAASMVLGADEFLAIKTTFVAQVLEKLRALARAEARLLFREHAHDPRTPLPELSTRLSRVINRATDSIEVALGRLTEDDRDLAWRAILRHLPAVLVDTAGRRLRERIPRSYLERTVAASLSARIVYREGPAYLETLPDDRLASLALSYLRQEQETAALIDEVSASALPHRDRIAELLERGGTRAGLEDGRWRRSSPD